MKKRANSLLQKNKYFPLPDYSFANRKVTVTITGKVIDMAYARKLALIPELTLHEILLPDKVQKGKQLSDNEIQTLRASKLIKGRKPNIHISASVALATNEKEEYIKMRGIEDAYVIKLIKKYLKEFEKGRKADFIKLLQNKLPEILNEQQKQHKIKNSLQKMKSENLIDIDNNRFWRLK